MAGSLSIGGNNVSIGANTIDFIGISAAAIDNNQLAIIAPVATNTNRLQVNQLALIAIADPPPAPMQVNQLALVMVVSATKDVISPDRAIGLECWQPCLSYGTQAIVYWKEA